MIITEVITEVGLLDSEYTEFPNKTMEEMIFKGRTTTINIHFSTNKMSVCRVIQYSPCPLQF
jgi:hypothetical protein